MSIDSNIVQVYKRDEDFGKIIKLAYIITTKIVVRNPFDFRKPPHKRSPPSRP